MKLSELADMVERGEGDKGFYPAMELCRKINEAGVSVTMGMIEGSIDAVERLRQELLTKSQIDVAVSFFGTYMCDLYKEGINSKELNIVLGSGRAPTEAAARLAALLRALEGKEG